MRVNTLQLTRAVSAVMLVLLLSAMGKANAQTYSYTYNPGIGTYTGCNTGTITRSVGVNNNCQFSSASVTYSKGVIHVTLYKHILSTGRMRFRIQKCDGDYFKYQNSGKYFIIDADTHEVLFCDDFYIDDNTTDELLASFIHEDFTGTKRFDVYMKGETAAHYQYKYYAGRIEVTGTQSGSSPIVTTKEAENITFTSAQLNGIVNPQGLLTTHYFQWGTSPSFGETSQEYTYYSDFNDHWVSLSIVDLQPGTTYYFRVRAYNDAGSDIGATYSFTTPTQYYPPEVTTNDATVNSAYSATLHGIVNPKGLTTTAWFEYGTTTSLGNSTPTTYLDDSFTNFPIQRTIDNLQPNTKYYFRACASNSMGQTQGSIKYFWTDAGGAPIATSFEATNITTNSAKLSGRVNPQGLTTSYYFEYGTSTNFGSQTVTGTLPGDYNNYTVEANISGLMPNTTYYFRIYAWNGQGVGYDSPRYFTTGQDNCYFPDCPAGELETASRYLCQRGIIEGINGNLEPNNNITRAQLAKASFFGLYSNSSGVNIPNPLVTDYFPCIYPDLQENSYYFQAAKALLYLEYGDGISPFDRDRSCFNPTGTISRCLVLKVLLETFNIAPATSGSNPFSDFPSTAAFWGYAKKAYDLGITQITTFRPYDPCTRGEAFLFLYRILLLIDNNTITKPNPNYDTYDPLNSDFFVPADISPEVANAIRGVEYGNFNYYNKDFFNIPGYMNLNFGISYNSYLTEMPDEFYPVKPLGKAWTHTYDMYMNIIPDNYNNISYYAFHMQDGALLIYRTENGALVKFTEGNYYTLTPTTPSASTYTLKSTGQISYTFTKKSDGIYYLTQIKDRNNNTITIDIGSSNGQFRINSVTTLGRTLTFGYTSDNLLNYVKDPSNRYVYFYYSGGQMTSLKDAKNQTTHFNYGTLDSEKGLLKEIQLPKGNYVYNDYKQRKLKSMSYVGLSIQTHTDIAITPNYQNGTTTSTVTESLSNNQSVTTTYTMNDKNRVTHVTDNINTDMSYQYGVGYPNNPDLLTKKTDNKTGLQTSYAYNDSNGLMTSITYSNGSETHTLTVQYNDFNDIKKYTDANGNVTNYTYSTTGNLNGITDALGKTTTIINNSYGVPTQVTNPMGLSINYEYNNYGNLKKINIPSLNVNATLTYDGISRMSTKTDFAGKTTSYTYDNNDNLVTITDADGKTTTYNYDANDNVTWIQNAKGYKTNFTYDFNTDFLTEMSFQGTTRSYTYNRDGSLKSFTNPNGHTFNYTYNNSGELTSDGYTSLQYNSSGQLWKVTKDSKPITYTYDSFDRISSIAYDGKTVSYTYDNNGNVLTITYPGNKTVTYTYDALNRMTSVKDWNNKTTTYGYRDDGQLDYYQYPNQVRTTYSYDNSGRYNGFSTKRNNGNGSVIAEYAFVMDNMGNHTSESFTEPFAAYPSIPTENITYSYGNNNRLNSAGNLSFGYDSNGNTTSRTGRSYSYDVKDNLASVSGDYTASFTYDGLGNRRSATRNGITTKYVLNLLGNLPMVLMETDANGSVQNYYIYGASGLISRIDANNNTSYYVYDFRGSTVAMTDVTTSANITHKYQYDDYGKLLQSEEADTNPFRYVGKMGVMYEDEALVFMRARYYDPEIGRFLSEDPIWSPNLYSYADNNPMMWIDSKGEDAVLAFATVMGSVGTASTAADFGIYGIDLDSQTGMNNYAMTWASTTVSIIGIVLTNANPVGAAATCLSAGISIGQLIGDKYDEEITSGMSKLIYNIKYKNKQKKQGSNLKPIQQDIREVDPEALNWIMTDPYGRQLKDRWYGVAEMDWSLEKKYEARVQLLKLARAYMTR